MKVEIWDSDPTGGCSCLPMLMSQQAMKKIMDSVKEKNLVLKRLRNEFKDVDFEIETVSPQRPASSYPDYVTRLLRDGAKAPMVLIDETLVAESRFPSYDEFKKVIEKKIGSHSV